MTIVRNKLTVAFTILAITHHQQYRTALVCCAQYSSYVITQQTSC